MKAVVVNGSARKNWNTAQLCRESARGLEEAGFETELINLCDYAFKGCVSCYGCHLKTSMDKHLCFYRDDLTPILEKLLEADVIILSSPVFYGEVSGQIRSLMERMLFPLDTYYAEDGKRVLKRNKKVPTGFIFTMNATKEQMTHYHMNENLHRSANALSGIYGIPCEELYSCDTLQFTDYSRYTVNIFDPDHKKEHHDQQFPIDLANAYEMGKRLAEKAMEIRKEEEK